jgi:hypothetical protein
MISSIQLRIFDTDDKGKIAGDVAKLLRVLQVAAFACMQAPLH